MATERRLTMKQRELVEEFVEAYDLDESQISFEGESPNPIFDYEALNVLRLELTDIEGSFPQVLERSEDLITVSCTLNLPDGRSATDLGTAIIGEDMPDGSQIETIIDAQNVALSRAFRRALRSAGINLVKAHRQFKETGKPTSGRRDPELASKMGREIHALATEIGHITKDSKEKYRDFIENIFGNQKRSSLDLNDIEKSKLIAIYRRMLATIRRAKGQSQAA